MEQSGKALHSGKNAEKRRSEAIKRELLVLVHDFLTEEGLFEGTYLFSIKSYVQCYSYFYPPH